MHVPLLHRGGALSPAWRLVLTVAVSLGAMRMAQTIAEGQGFEVGPVGQWWEGLCSKDVGKLVQVDGNS